MSLNPGLDDRLAALRLKSGREQRMAGAQTSEALGSSSYRDLKATQSATRRSCRVEGPGV